MFSDLLIYSVFSVLLLTQTQSEEYGGRQDYLFYLGDAERGPSASSNLLKYDPRLKRWASQLRFGKRSSWASKVRFG